jgi:lipopolysaccharide export system protein LptA
MCPADRLPRTTFRLAAILGLLLFGGSPVALEGDRERPIELAADSVDIDEGRGTSVYRGDVDLRQGSMRLQADVVTVHQRGRRPVRVEAEGRPVRFSQQSARGPVRGEARRMEYDIDSENLVLQGDAVLVQGKDSMRSDRIVYDRERAVVKAGAAADGQQRVRISIQPPAE